MLKALLALLAASACGFLPYQTLFARATQGAEFAAAMPEQVANNTNEFPSDDLGQIDPERVGEDRVGSEESGVKDVERPPRATDEGKEDEGKDADGKE